MVAEGGVYHGLSSAGHQNDELVEVTPKSLRLRKRVLQANMRPRRSQE